MALVKCKECSHEISKSAKLCPNCGHSRERRKFGLGTLILVIVVGGWLGAKLTPEAPTSASPKAAAEKPAPTPKTEEELRAEEVRKAFSGWDGSHRELERYIKKNLKDPGSYEHIETKFVDNGDTVTVFTTYRAKNSYGGYAVESARAEASVNGKLINVSIGE